MQTTEEKLFTGMDEIDVLLKSRRRAILVNTFEEGRFVEQLKDIIEAKSYEGYTWSVTAGLKDAVTGISCEKKHYDPIKLMDHIMDHDKQAIFILKDFHDIWNNYQAKRALRDVLESHSNIYKPIILVSHEKDIPAELEKLITVVEYELPTREQVIEQLEGMESYCVSKNLPVPEGREREAVIHGLTGMTQTEMVQVMKKSIAKNFRISSQEIVNEKEQVIRKTGLLEYIKDAGDMSNVGGLDVMKDWFADAHYAFSPKAREFGVDPVRGAIAAGFPGVGKSLVAKSVANMWNLPLLRMNMSDIMSSKVGGSEKNIKRALRLAEAVAPVVLWIDEIEKGLSGVSSSDQSDAGTTSRVFQEILTWLSEKKSPVFVIATANDISKMPPELTRAGRFDEIFFVGLPHEEERADILSIHLRKRGYSVRKDISANDFDQFNYDEVQELASTMDGFTGAEIEQVVSEAGRRAYAKFCKKERDHHYILKSDIQEQVDQVIPMSKRNPKLLKSLREWAKHSAKCASSAEHKLIHGKSYGKAKLHSIEEFNVPDLEIEE